jgi:hypothetical protein
MMRDMCASRRVYVISGSVQYLLLMDVFPSALGGCLVGESTCVAH